MLSRETPQYKAALEIELWKEIRVQDYEAYLLKGEKMVLSDLTSAFKEEHAKLESDIRVCKQSYDQMLKQYRDKLGALEKREKKHVQSDTIFDRTYSSFLQERSSKLHSIKVKSSHKSDFLNLEIENLLYKISDAETLNKRLRSRMEDTEKSLQIKETESSVQSNHVPADLQESLLNARIDFNNTKHRLAKVSVAKERYKVKLKSVLEELSVPCGPAVHHVPLRTTPDPPSSSVATKPQGQCGIMSQLESIISSLEKEEKEKPGVVSREGVETDIAMLISERNTLLNTGVYRTGDHIIQQLDTKINSLLKVNSVNSGMSRSYEVGDGKQR